MHIKITGSPPRTRCYKCGTTNVEGVCHHCHRPMCSLHIRQPVDFQGRLLSMEFTQLGLRETSGEIPVHCEFCHHLDIPIHWVLLLSGIGIFFLAFILPFDDLERFIGFLIASTTTALGFYIYIMRKSKLVQSRPFLPLLPRLNPIKIREIIRGRISLDSKGDYQVYIPYAEGIITVASNLGKAERDQLEQYQRKYHLADSRDVQFIAGFLSLKSSMGVTYLDNLFTGDNTIWRLRGTHPFSTNFERYQSGEWHKSRRYNLIKIASSRSFPIRIIPTLIQGAAQRSLDLEIQWIEGIKGTNNFAIHKIDSLQIQVPAIWGQIQDANGGMVASINDQKVDNVVNTITWNGVPIPDSERTRGHHTFSISFEDPIDVSNSIYGSLVVTFTGTFSDVEEINLFYPQGGQRQVDSVDISTQLIVDFELSLAGLRYQDIRVVPDLVKDKDKLEPLVVKGITPDYETVIALTNAISEKFYIKRIIENPPRTGERANLVNRPLA